MKQHFTLNLLCAIVLFISKPVLAQNTSVPLPNAPEALFSQTAQQTTPTPFPTTSARPPEVAPKPLTREDAEKIALANNPRIQLAQLLARVQHQAVRERQADELPNMSGSLTAVAANDGSRISSAPLTASRLLEHAGMGVQMNQLITDFGRTPNLVASSKLMEKARTSDAEASREDIVLATDQVFYQVIEAQETVKVAMQTVAARQALVDQVSALTSSKLRSELDLSFAKVNLSQAKLLLLNAQNELDASRAAFSAVLGYGTLIDVTLVDDIGALPPLASNPDVLIAEAIQNRPDLQSLKYAEQAAQKFSAAQHRLLLPTISALGVVGATPVGSPQYFTGDWYGAIGGNINIPIFNGFRFTAQAAQASLQAQAAVEQTRLLHNQVVRDVRTAWLNANTSLQKVTVTTELLAQTNTAMELAKTRYDLGLSSIVELSQAELQQIEAAIGNANAVAQYKFAIAAIRFQTGVRP
ncbi:MAG: TolC family protein [Acidobacteria bacterium]|nr:TolC family protein [Acidobacteriota bacterium]